MRNMTEIIMAAPVRGSRHRSISPQRRLQLGKDYSPSRSSPNIVHSGKPNLLRSVTSSTIILRRHGRQRDDSPLLTSRRESKTVHKDTQPAEVHSEVSHLGIALPKTDAKNTHLGGSQETAREATNCSACLPKLSSPVSTPPVPRRRAWTIDSNKYLKSALNCSPGSSPAALRKKRNSSSPKFNFTSLPSSRQSSSKSSTSQGKTVTFVPKVQRQVNSQTVESSISKTEKNIHIISSQGEGSEVIHGHEKSNFTDIHNLDQDQNNRDNTKSNIKHGESKVDEGQSANKTQASEKVSPLNKKMLPEGLSSDVYQKCLRWLEGVRAADDNKYLDVVTQPDLQWQD